MILLNKPIPRFSLSTDLKATLGWSNQQVKIFSLWQYYGDNIHYSITPLQANPS